MPEDPLCQTCSLRIDGSSHQQFYRVAEILASPAVFLYLLTRVLSDRRYFSTLGERFGGLSALWQKTASEAIWLHAVSVGEVLAAAPLAEAPDGIVSETLTRPPSGGECKQISPGGAGRAHAVVGVHPA